MWGGFATIFNGVPRSACGWSAHGLARPPFEEVRCPRDRTDPDGCQCYVRGYPPMAGGLTQVTLWHVISFSHSTTYPFHSIPIYSWMKEVACIIADMTWWGS